MTAKCRGEPFGYLLTLDLYECGEGVCEDLGLCYQFLVDVTRRLKMNSQSPPFVFQSDEVTYPDKAGISGWIPLIESGIQIHTLTEENFISIDVYSCKRFSSSGITQYVKDYFRCNEVETNFVERGIKYYDGDRFE